MEKREIINTAVTLEALKTHLRIANNVFDSDLEGKLRAAHLVAENYIGQVLMKSRFTLSAAFTGVLPLRHPVDKVDSVTINKTSVPYTVTDEGLLIVPGVHEGTMEVTYTAGDDQTNDDIKVAIMMIAGDLFNNPVDKVEQLPRASQMLLRPYRRYKFNG